MGAAWLDDIRISLMLMSRNRCDRLVGLFDSIAATANVPKRIEVLVKIDRDDAASLALMHSGMTDKYPFKVRFVVGDQKDGYFSSGEVINQLLVAASPSSYFVSVINDRNRFAAKGWDDILMTYRHILAHDIFYIRFWPWQQPWEESCFTNGFWSPDDLAIYTRKLMSLMEGYGDRYQLSPWLSAILSGLKFKYHQDIDFLHSPTFYSAESITPNSTGDPVRFARSRRSGQELSTAPYIELSYDRIARNIAEYLQQLPKG